jgi:UDP-N-acetylglucosamine 2-epimerase
LAALAARGNDMGVILTGSNADPEGAMLTAIMREFAAEQDNFVFHESLGTKRYFAALRYCDAMVGNSSSGLYEAPSFALSAVNIGNRQKGRLRAQSVIDCAPDRVAIGAAINEALARPRTAVVNPYGEGRAAEKIAAVLKTVREPRALTVKKFYQGA